tara:strand:+ start:1209 stop:1625 length:417 start_codon:yes stop_codon:yes gene_type:complete
MSLFLMLLAAAPAVAETAGQSGPHIDWLFFLRVLLTTASLATGVFFVLAGTFGVLRLPDFYTRLHAAGMTDTLGAELILLGLIIQSGFSQMSLKLMLVGFLLLVTSPTATHAVAHAAYKAGLKPVLGRYRAPSLEEDS